MRRYITIIAFIFSVCISASGSFAQSNFLKQFQNELYAGKLQKAASTAEGRLKVEPSNDQARFALGAAQFLNSIEGLGRALYRHGLKSGEYNRGLAGLAGLPILRLPIPENPKPETLSYDQFRSILNRFASELANADITLGGIKKEQIDLPLNLSAIRIDLTGTNNEASTVSLMQLFAAVSGVVVPEGETVPDMFADFDASDVEWLRGYCHLLMAVAEFPLAYEWQEAFEVSFQGLFRLKPSSFGKLQEAADHAVAQLEKLEPQPPGLPKGMTYREWYGSKEQQEHARVQKLRRPYERIIDYSGIADLIAFVHLNHWPVKEPDRLKSVLEHLEAMVGLSRRNWKLILKETDNNAEWIPNPQQTGIFPEIRLNEQQVEGWHNFLDEFEAVLQGKKLIPHWRFSEGINLRRFFLEPTAFDIVLMVQGATVIPYLENGEKIDHATWLRIQRLLGGDFFRYFLWFN